MSTRLKPVSTLRDLSIQFLRKYVSNILDAHKAKCTKSETNTKINKLKCKKCRHVRKYLVATLAPNLLKDVLLDIFKNEFDDRLRKVKNSLKYGDEIDFLQFKSIVTHVQKIVLIFWNSKMNSLCFFDELQHLPLLYEDTLYICKNYGIRITHLTANFEIWIKPKHFQKILKCLVNLTSLKINNRPNNIFPNDNLKIVVNFCSKLSKITFCFHPNLIDFLNYIEGNESICESLTEIGEDFSQHSSNSMFAIRTRKNFYEGIQKLPNLEHVFCREFNFKLLAELISEGKNFPKHIKTMRDSNNVDIKDLRLVAEKCKEIKSLEFGRIGHDIIQNLKLFNKVTVISVNEISWTPFESYLNDFGKNITKLHMLLIEDVNIAQLARLCPNLKFFEFFYCHYHVSENSVFNLLEEFKFHYHGQIKEDPPLLTRILKMMPNLKIFTYSHVYFTDDDVQIIINTKILWNLEHLRLQNVYDICSFQSVVELLDYFPNLISIGDFKGKPVFHKGIRTNCINDDVSHFSYFTDSPEIRMCDDLCSYVKTNNLRVEVL